MTDGVSPHKLLKQAFRLAFAAAALGVAWGPQGFAQAPIQLKARQFVPDAGMDAADLSAGARRSPGAWHMLLQFDSEPDAARLEAMAARGISWIAYVPGGAVVASVPDGTVLDGLGVRWAGRLLDSDKISPALLPKGTAALGYPAIVVSLHPDTDVAAIRKLFAEQGLLEVPHPDLAPFELLVSGGPQAVAALARWDEVAYLYPASEDLAAGERVRACAGAITMQGWVGQYAKVSQGWRKSGAPLTELGYFFRNFTTQLDPARTRGEIERAFAEWSRWGGIRFRPAAAAELSRSIDVLFASRWHGDPYPFDGPGGVLAHTFYPSPPNAEPLAGDLHLDAEESWAIGRPADLFSVVLHETGHALGLGHSDAPGSVMYPYYRQNTGLAPDDIQGIQELYGPPVATPPPASPTPPPASPAPPPAAPSGPAIVLDVQAPRQPVTVASNVLPASGVISGGTPPYRIAWRVEGGGGGDLTVSGARQPAPWQFPVVLKAGANAVTVTATDSAGASRTALLPLVTSNAPAGSSGVPVLTILSPPLALNATQGSSASIRGTASSPVGLREIRWRSNSGASGTATGSTSWTIEGIPLYTGLNSIEVTAFDREGGHTSRYVSFSRK